MIITRAELVSRKPDSRTGRYLLPVGQFIEISPRIPLPA